MHHRAHHPFPWRLDRRATRLAGGLRRAVRPACGRRAVAGGEAPHVRAGRRRAAAGLLLRRGRAAPRPRARRRRATHSAITTAPSWARTFAPRASASTATAATAWPGTATRSAAVAPRTRWSRSSPSARLAPLLLRPRGGGQTLRYPLGHGDLIVMGGSCQRTWEHAVPKIRPGRRTAHQHPVPPAWRPLTSAEEP